MNTVQYEVVPSASVEAQQVQQEDQQEASQGDSGAPRVANPPQTEQRGGGEGEPGRVTRQKRRKSAAPKRFSNSG